MKILHIADSHIGAGLPLRPRRKMRRRGDDVIASYRRAVGVAFERDVDLLIHAGDLFDMPAPGSGALTAAAEPLLRVAAAGIPVVIVPGNHERCAIPASVLFAHENIHLLDKPATLEFKSNGTRLAVCGFPCIRRNSAAAFADTLRATGWERSTADVRILVAHQTFESAVCGPVAFRFRSGDDVVERDAVPPEFDYVAAGHIHRHPTLDTPADGPAIVYAGSPERISFAEIGEPKGCVLIETTANGIEHTFVEHAVRPMAVVPLDVSGLSRKQLVEALDAQLTALPPEAVAQLRFSGRTTRATLGGLRLAAHCRERRPDANISISTQAVEFVADRDVVRRGVVRRRTNAAVDSAFASLDAPAEPLHVADASHPESLPTGRAVYACYDAAERLLYVGKAANVRTRVRTHLRGSNSSSFFRGWTRQITRIEVRPAASDLEAMLVEAELIRRLRPPFNRQMRSWAGYRYLCQTGKPHAQLEVCREATPGRKCFGPFRGKAAAAEIAEAVAACLGTAACPDEPAGSGALLLIAPGSGASLCERYFDRRCAGPCARRVPDGDYGRMIAARDALLSGRDDTAVVACEQELAAMAEKSDETRSVRELRRRVHTLRAAFEHASVLRRAEALLNGVVIIPDGDRGSTAIFLGKRGIAICRFRACDSAGLVTVPPDVKDWHARLVGRMRRARGRLPKDLLDGMTTAARFLVRDGDDFAFVAVSASARVGRPEKQPPQPASRRSPVPARTQARNPVHRRPRFCLE